MKADRTLNKVFFYATSLLPCPYIEGQVERRMVTELLGKDADVVHNALSKSGFRRSHFMAYAPVCPSCSACIPVRVVVDEFYYSKNRKRVLKRFDDIEVTRQLPKATHEQFDLFQQYQKMRHGDGDMSGMDFFDYRSMVEESPVNTSIIEFRRQGVLVGCLLMDQLDDGLSAVYSFFDSAPGFSGFGTYIVLKTVEMTKEMNLPYTYLGYLISKCNKMSYKARFTPLEGCIDGVWSNLDQSLI